MYLYNTSVSMRVGLTHLTAYSRMWPARRRGVFAPAQRGRGSFPAGIRESRRALVVTQDDISAGLRSIRRKRSLSVAIVLAMVLLSVLSILPGCHWPPHPIVTVAVGTVLLLPANYRWLLAHCPRCGKKFFVSDSMVHNPLRMTCRHCGLSLYGERNGG